MKTKEIAIFGENNVAFNILYWNQIKGFWSEYVTKNDRAVHSPMEIKDPVGWILAGVEQGDISKKLEGPAIQLVNSIKGGKENGR